MNPNIRFNEKPRPLAGAFVTYARPARVIDTAEFWFQGITIFREGCNTLARKTRYSVKMPVVREEVRELLLEIIKRRVSLRAYELYEARGRTHGRDLDDWLQAEDEILGQSISVPLYAERKPLRCRI